MNRPPAPILLALALAAAHPPAAPAQPSPTKATEIVLRPAAEPNPALKYRLVPPRRALEPGNAAIFYHRALLLYHARRDSLDRPPALAGPGARGGEVPVDERVGDWINRPIGSIPRDEARAVLGQFADALAEVDLGVRRLDCDWQFDRRPEGLSLLLPEIQGIRPLARLIRLQAILAIGDGDFDRAFARAEVGFGLARHVARGPIVIQGLVGVAIANEMHACLRELIQSPGAPSLYWALANRPRPFIDLRDAFDAELAASDTELPGLRDLERGTWGRDRTLRFVEAFRAKYAEMAPGYPILGTGLALPVAIPPAVGQLGIAASCAKVYPEARRALIAGGRPEAEVDAMPVVQVACLAGYRAFRRTVDDMAKGLDLPYWQLAELPRAAGFADVEAKGADPIWAALSGLASELRPARLAMLRLDRQLDALQCVEAIRLEASSHGGKLPAGLDSIRAFPCPLDEATGRPFEYEVTGGSARLAGPVPAGAPDHPSYMIRYVLKPAP